MEFTGKNPLTVRRYINENGGLAIGYVNKQSVAAWDGVCYAPLTPGCKVEVIGKNIVITK